MNEEDLCCHLLGNFSQMTFSSGPYPSKCNAHFPFKSYIRDVTGRAGNMLVTVPNFFKPVYSFLKS